MRVLKVSCDSSYSSAAQLSPAQPSPAWISGCGCCGGYAAVEALYSVSCAGQKLTTSVVGTPW